MHYHCEIVIPPTRDIEGAIQSVLAQFNENAEGEDGSDYAFWDFWVIGGRWAGHKLLAKYDKAKMDAFHEWMTAEKITVSSLQAGKQELSPASQISKVDAKWNEMFPSETHISCPLFNHSNDKYADGLRGTLPSDISKLSDVSSTLECSRVIFAKPSYESSSKDHTGPLEAAFMLCDSQYNGCNYMKIDWDGKFSTAVVQYRDSLKNYKEEYAAKISPTDDWLAVTVDYHS